MAMYGEPVGVVMDDELEGREKEIYSWMIRIRGYYETEGDRTQLIQALESLKEKKPEVYDFMIHQILSWAAEKEDMDTFRWILDTQEIRHFTRVDVLAELSWLFVYQEKKKRKLGGPLFLTEKEEFLDEMVRKIGISRTCSEYSKQYLTGEDGVLSSSLPDAYLAILTGNLHMAEYFYRKGAYASGALEYVLEEDVTCSGLVIKEAGFDVLSVAIESGSCEMVEFVLRHFPDLPWNRNLFRKIMSTDSAMAQMILEYHPELFDFISIEEILEYGNDTFLSAWKE